MVEQSRLQLHKEHLHPRKFIIDNSLYFVFSEYTNWVYINGLGERDTTNVTESDILTAITFDKSGEYLAVGDRGGRVIIFRYLELKNSRYFDYRYFSEIQSHEPEFDHLKSIELDEKINALDFLRHH
jgi:serine/threonine-protein phosphatase 2A regulatory subunit B